jgi:enediyne biosynthesis protein E4
VRPERGPARLFFMAEKSGGQFLPLRSPGVFAALLPEVAARFENYQALTAATVADLAGGDSLDAAVRLDAAVLESGVFLNTPPAKEREAPRFEFRPLPVEAQLAPVFGMAVTDFDGDCDMDVLVAQNARNSAPGEPQRDSGLCALLLNDGAGAFTAMPAAASGLTFHNEHRACTVADLNFDNRPDAVLSVWRGGLLGLANTGSGGQFLRINLPPSRAPGARVKVERGQSPAIIADYCAGGGWLSQSVPAIFVGLGQGPRDGVVSVRWSDGTSWVQTFDEKNLTLKVPAR